jgi:hypothetical protein
VLEIESLVAALNKGGVEYIVNRAAGRPQDLEDLARLPAQD